MIIIDLQGIIGWEIRTGDVADKLAQADGDDIVVRLSTMGGDIFDGADIVNMFMDYKRDNPGAVMNMEVKAIAASYGSALVSAGIWDNISVSSISAFMIHNALGGAYGNSQELLSVAEFLDGVTAMYRRLYSDQSGKTVEEITALMDAETWYFGQEIIDEGFADKIISMDDEGGEQLPLDNDADHTIILFEMKKQREAMMEKQRGKAIAEGFDIKRAAACLRIPEPKLEDEIPADGGENKPVPTGKKQTEVPMDKAELKEKNPAVHTEVFDEGIAKERGRVKALGEMKRQDEYKDIPEVVAAIDKAIDDGKSVEETQPLILAAMVKLTNDPGRTAEVESPGDIQGGDEEAPVMVHEKIREV